MDPKETAAMTEASGLVDPDRARPASTTSSGPDGSAHGLSMPSQEDLERWAEELREMTVKGAPLALCRLPCGDMGGAPALTGSLNRSERTPCRTTRTTAPELARSRSLRSGRAAQFRERPQ